jgi:hypothetical protein
MEGYCSTGQGPQRAVVPKEEEEVCFLLITIYSLFMNVYHKKSYSVKKNQSIRALFTPHEFKLFSCNTIFHKNPNHEMWVYRQL